MLVDEDGVRTRHYELRLVVVRPAFQVRTSVVRQVDLNGDPLIGDCVFIDEYEFSLFVVPCRRDPFRLC